MTAQTLAWCRKHLPPLSSLLPRLRPHLPSLASLVPSSRLHLPPRPVLAHAARTTLAALLALWIAYALEINNPFSGAITVMIVAHPVHGLVLTKSLYRFAGTLVGAAMATLLMGLFAQTPEMFLLFLSLWMGVCTFGSTLLRNFQSYGTVLAGYTVALICLPGTEAPQMTFDLITSRVAVVSLGIACSGVVAALTTSGSAARGMRSSFKAALGALGAYIRLALAGSGEDLMAPARAKLSAQIAGLDAQVDFAAVEAAQVAPLRDALRAGLAAMLGCLTAATSLRDALGRAGDGLRDKTQEMETVLADIDAALACGESRTAAAALSAADDRLVAMMAALDTELSPDRLPLLVVQDRLSEVLDELRIAVNGMVGLLTGEIPATVANSGDSLRRLAFHLDWRGGLINGVRATIAVWLAGAIWIGTAWPYGWMMVATAVPNAGLLALRDHPELDAVEFIKGCTLASALAWIALLYLLPLGDSFVWLCVVIGPVLYAGVVMSVNPKTVFIGVGLMVFFLTLLTPTNPMTYDVRLFLNSVLPTIGGAVLTMVVFRLILPQDARGHALALVRTIRHDIQRLLSSRREIAPTDWESRMHDRLLRLVGRMRVSEMNHPHLVRGGFAALRIGREIIRTRRLLAEFGDDLAINAIMAPARAALRGIERSPVAAVTALRTTAAALLNHAAEHRPEALPVLARVAASLAEVAMLLGRHRRFFHALPVK